MISTLGLMMHLFISENTLSTVKFVMELPNLRGRKMIVVAH
jgi:hypothetical protein